MHSVTPAPEVGPSSDGGRDSDAGSGKEAGSGSGCDESAEWDDKKGQSRQMTQEERKAHKKQVKADAQERRKHKLPKHIKKKATKAHKR